MRPGLVASTAVAVVLGFVLAGPLGAQETNPAPVVTVAIQPGSAAQAWVEALFEIPPGLHQSLQPEYFGVSVDPATLPAGWSVGEAVFPPSEHRILDLPSWEGSVLVRVPLAGPPQGDAVDLGLTVRWQLCYDDGVCLIPETASAVVTVSSTPGLGWTAPAVSVARVVPDLGTAFALDAGPEPGSGTTGPSLVVVVFFALLGGLILNFMPCVLPVLSIKALGLAKQAGTDRRARWAHAWAAAAGILTSLWVLALAVIALQATGTSVGWGVQFQSPLYVLALVSLVWVFALSLFDVFVVSAPTVSQGRVQGLGGSFLSGLFTVVLATPCTAPFLGTALGFALGASWWLILVVFTAIGVGLALPFFLVTVVPGVLERLPKPGPWMDVVKDLLGFALVGTALWLLGVLQAQTSGPWLTGVWWWLGLLAVAAWVLGRVQRSSVSGAVLASTLALIVLGLGTAGVFLVRQDPARPEAVSQASGPWEVFSEDRVAEAKALGRPVFVDFTAEWCLTCKVNEAGVLADAEVLGAFQRANVLLLRGDYTNADPVIARWLKENRRAGVPFYAYLAPGRDLLVLPELLDKNQLLGLPKL